MDTQIICEKEKRTTIAKALKSDLRDFVITIFVVVILTHFVFINAYIPSGSMETTIMTGDRLIGFRMAYVLSKPKRGDIVMFNAPDESDSIFIKRLIGLPGETVTIHDSHVYINGKELEEDYVKDKVWCKEGESYTFVVPDDCYLMLGDNRNNSDDARYWKNTYVTKENIVAKAMFRYYPF